jgi:sugar-specific transcriptional regulator TrmB
MRLQAKHFLLLVPIVTLISCAKFTTSNMPSPATIAPKGAPIEVAQGDPTDLANRAKDILTITPDDGQKPVIEAINNAKNEILMEMYHLTQQPVIDALVQAVQRKVIVRVIIDSKSIVDAKGKQSFDALKAGGVDVRGSSRAFSITHSKAMAIDKNLAFISSINMTSLYKYARDFGVFTSEAKVVSDLTAIFEADWKNAVDNSMVTPSLSSDRIIVSPTNSADILMEFINNSKTSILLYVENLGSQEILKAIEAAARRGVDVKVNVPLCDLNPDIFYNTKPKDELIAAGVHFRVMPGRGTPDIPYIHAKMILVDNQKAYIGSVNFSINSLHFARETGIFVSQADILQKLKDTFMKDWPLTIEVPATLDKSLCGGSATGPAAAGGASTPDEVGARASVTYVYSSGRATGFCDGGPRGFFCIDQLKKNAKNDSLRDAEIRCSVQRGVLDSMSATCTDTCNPFSIPDGQLSQMVSCSSSCNTRCELP